MHTLVFHRPPGIRALGFCLAGLAMLLGGLVQAQSLRIQDLIRTNGATVVTYPSDPSRYYVLYRGDRVEQAFLPKDAVLGLTGVGLLQDRLPPREQAFYRVVSVPLDRPLDLDGDGIDDVYELSTPGLNALVAADALRPVAARPICNAIGNCILSRRGSIGVPPPWARRMLRSRGRRSFGLRHPWPRGRR